MFIFGCAVTLLAVVVIMEIGFRAIKDKEEREKRRYIWEKEILRVGKEGSGLRK